jgi:hypothetical protein
MKPKRYVIALTGSLQGELMDTSVRRSRAFRHRNKLRMNGHPRAELYTIAGEQLVEGHAASLNVRRKEK